MPLSDATTPLPILDAIKKEPCPIEDVAEEPSMAEDEKDEKEKESQSPASTRLTVSTPRHAHKCAVGMCYIA